MKFSIHFDTDNRKINIEYPKDRTDICIFIDTNYNKYLWNILNGVNQEFKKKRFRIIKGGK